MTEATVKAKPVYKKTSRTRTVEKHSKLDIVREALEQNLRIVLNRTVEVRVERSTEQRYARALFRVSIGDMVIDGRTMEEVLQIAEGIQVVSELKEAA